MWPGTACAKFTASFTRVPDSAEHENPKLAACPRPVRCRAPATSRSTVTAVLPKLSASERGV